MAAGNCEPGPILLYEAELWKGNGKTSWISVVCVFVCVGEIVRQVVTHFNTTSRLVEVRTSEAGMCVDFIPANIFSLSLCYGVFFFSLYFPISSVSHNPLQ